MIFDCRFWIFDYQTPAQRDVLTRQSKIENPKSKLAAVVLTLALGLLAGPLAAGAQQSPKVARIGFISGSSPATAGHTFEAFRQGLRDLGYVEGQNLAIEARWAEGKAERFPDLIADLIRSKVNVIVVASTAGAVAGKKANVTIPIVFAAVADPVGLGIIESLARPGGNLTGVSLAIGEGFSAKWVELLRETVPKVSRMAVLVNPAAPSSGIYLREMQGAARALRVRLQLFEARDLEQLESAFRLIEKDTAGALVVTAEPLFFVHRARIIEFAAKRRMPAMYFFREFVDGGGLMGYGPSLPHSFGRAAIYVDKILKGAKPADLPVEQPTVFEFVLNLKTAKALGLTIPQSILIRADQVIQ
jgi:putative ABC transport system substrate-binding protein